MINAAAFSCPSILRWVNKKGNDYGSMENHRKGSFQSEGDKVQARKTS